MSGLWQNIQRQLLRHIIRVTKRLYCDKTYSAITPHYMCD